MAGAPLSLLDLIDWLPVGVLLMAAGWRITYVNVEADKLLGPRASLLGETIWERFPATVGTEFEAGDDDIALIAVRA